MNQKTESTEQAPRQEQEFSSAFLQGLIALTVATLLIVFVLERYVVPEQHFSVSRISLFPWVTAGGHLIAQGLSLFSGYLVSPITLGQQLELVISTWVLLVLGPTLFFFGWRDRLLAKQQGDVSSKLQLSTVVFMLGGIVTYTAAIPVVPMAIIQYVVSQRMQRSQAISTNRDNIINEANMVMISAFQYRVLPQRLGGGAGSYAGYVLPTEFASTPDGTYRVEEATDQEVTIAAASSKYPGATVSVKIGKNGRPIPASWQYTGEFR